MTGPGRHSGAARAVPTALITSPPLPSVSFSLPPSLPPFLPHPPSLSRPLSHSRARAQPKNPGSPPRVQHGPRWSDPGRPRQVTARPTRIAARRAALSRGAAREAPAERRRDPSSWAPDCGPVLGTCGPVARLSLGFDALAGTDGAELQFVCASGRLPRGNERRLRSPHCIKGSLPGLKLSAFNVHRGYLR